MPSPDDLRLIDRLHGGFPLSDRPFAEVAATLGCTEDMLIDVTEAIWYGFDSPAEIDAMIDSNAEEGAGFDVQKVKAIAA